MSEDQSKFWKELFSTIVKSVFQLFGGTFWGIDLKKILGQFSFMCLEQKYFGDLKNNAQHCCQNCILPIRNCL